MNTIGIIAEYNPFHNGHIYQLKCIRRQYPKARILALMSGSFTQRGCPAVLDKWQRAEHAILGGVDLVLELPTAFAVRSAQDFARGGVSLLARLGIVDGLAFGAESSLSLLHRVAVLMDTKEVQENLHSSIRNGMSYAAAMSRAIAAVSGVEERLLKKPNNILALEYLRTLYHGNSGIKALILKRMGADHHDAELHENYASASAVRQEIYSSLPDRENLAKVLPASTLSSLFEARSEGRLPDISLLLRPLLVQLECCNAEELKAFYGINEGLENRIMRAAFHCRTLDELIVECCSCRYPKSRIQRVLIHCLLRLHREKVHMFDQAGPLYARILAFNRTGKGLLHEIKKNSVLPLVSKTSHFLKDAALKRLPKERTLLENMLALDIRATELRRLCLPALSAHGEDLRKSPVFISATP